MREGERERGREGERERGREGERERGREGERERGREGESEGMSEVSSSPLQLPAAAVLHPVLCRPLHSLTHHSSHHMCPLHAAQRYIHTYIYTHTYNLCVCCTCIYIPSPPPSRQGQRCCQRWVWQSLPISLSTRPCCSAHYCSLHTRCVGSCTCR